MDTQIDNYFNCLCNSVLKKIESEIDEVSAKSVIEKDLSKYIRGSSSDKFHEYYFQTLDNEEEFFANNNFFRQFKSKYSLQGIDNDFLQSLESKKPEMLALIRKDDLPELYFNYFAKAKIKYRDRVVTKNLGSFFAKFVHTFRPTDYCALDNPIKNYFSLNGESFFISFLAVSNSYKTWAEKQSDIINEIRLNFKKLDKTEFFKHDKISNPKILDLIFLSKVRN